eukprot:2021972-Rhodomonas_salina.1
MAALGGAEWGWMAGTIDLRGSGVGDCEVLRRRHSTESKVTVLCDSTTTPPPTTSSSTTTPPPTTTPYPAAVLPCNCSGNGYCPGGTGLCVCYRGWAGTNCSEAVPGPPIAYCFSLGTPLRASYALS